MAVGRYTEDNSCPETAEGIPLKLIIYKLDFVSPRSLLHGHRKTCSSIVIATLIFVLKMSSLSGGRVVPRKVLVVH